MAVAESATNGFKEVIKEDTHLKTFLASMKDFDDEFCRLMFTGDDFTLRLEVHCNKGELLHARVYRDHIRKPPGK